jgi:copper transport protein
MLLAAVNLLRTRPRLVAAREIADVGEPAARLLRRLVGGEVLLVAAAIFAAAVLSSLPPPSKALASVGRASAHVGPGPVANVVSTNGYRLELHVTPNRAAVPNAFSVRLTRNGEPVRGADVTAGFTMLDMEMGRQAYHLAETTSGVYAHSAPALVMVGHWALSFDVQPPGRQPFEVLLVDRANG